MITVEIDPRLVVPPVTGAEYENRDTEVIDYSDVGFDLVDLAELNTSPSSEGSSGLQPPSGVVVLQQTTRMSSSGQMVIDVLLEVSDAPGAAEYEVRMATG